MSRILRAACAAAVAATLTVAASLTVPGLAQTTAGDVTFEPAVVSAGRTVSAAAPVFVQNTVVQQLPQSTEVATQNADEDDDFDRQATLAATVDAASTDEAANEQHRCLAAGVFYESRAESLEGQLAVANVILNRAKSGRFASTPCGVLTQRGQFSFVRGGAVQTPRDSAQWRTALAVARVAMTDNWDSPVPGALFFHATHVSPGWSRTRMARVGNHIFYR